MSKEYGISNAKPYDVEEWMRFVVSVSDDFPGFDEKEYEVSLTECISRETAICAKDKGRIVGTLLYSLAKSTIDFLAVSPECRGNGIASSIIEAMVMKFPPNQDIWVTTYREGDIKGEAARRLYRRMGFIEDELVEEFGYPCQKLVYRTS